MIKKLIFDLDNTLIIWKDEYSLELKYLLEEYKIDTCYKKVDKIIDDLEYKHDTISKEILLNDDKEKKIEKVEPVIVTEDIKKPSRFISDNLDEIKKQEENDNIEIIEL